MTLCLKGFCDCTATKRLEKQITAASNTWDENQSQPVHLQVTLGPRMTVTTLSLSLTLKVRMWAWVVRGLLDQIVGVFPHGGWGKSRQVNTQVGEIKEVWRAEVT